jgi:GNAT superfamily N-acetyltransferase
MKKLWLLKDLFVNPNFRQKGISIGLIKRAKGLLVKSKAGGMYLETDKSNIGGNKLYPKRGFTLNQASTFYEWDVEKY